MITDDQVREYACGLVEELVERRMYAPKSARSCPICDHEDQVAMYKELVRDKRWEVFILNHATQDEESRYITFEITDKFLYVIYNTKTEEDYEKFKVSEGFIRTREALEITITLHMLRVLGIESSKLSNAAYTWLMLQIQRGPIELDMPPLNFDVDIANIGDDI